MLWEREQNLSHHWRSDLSIVTDPKMMSEFNEFSIVFLQRMNSRARLREELAFAATHNEATMLANT